MRTDGRQDMTKLIIASHNFAKAPNNGSLKVTVSLRSIKITQIDCVGRTCNFLMLHLVVHKVATGS